MKERSKVISNVKERSKVISKQKQNVQADVVTHNMMGNVEYCSMLE